MKIQELRQQTYCFTGHRNVPKMDVDHILDRLERLVYALVEKGVTTFCVGGAIGFDTIAAQFLLYLREIKGLNIRVILICPFDGFTNRWNQTQKNEFASLLPQFDEVIYKENTARRKILCKRFSTKSRMELFDALRLWSEPLHHHAPTASCPACAQ